MEGCSTRRRFQHLGCLAHQADHQHPKSKYIYIYLTVCYIHISTFKTPLLCIALLPTFY